MVLAAGQSTRMGRPKGLLDAGGTTFVNRLAATLAGGGCDPVLVVVSSTEGRVAAETAKGPGQAVVNPGGAGGQIGSLRTALDHLRALRRPPDAVAFTPVDNPLVKPETVRLLIESWRRSRASIVLPRFGCERGHPVLIDIEVAPEFYRDDLVEGARTVIRRDAARTLEVPVSDPGIVDDLDTLDEYRVRFPGASVVGVDR